MIDGPSLSSGRNDGDAWQRSSSLKARETVNQGTYGSAALEHSSKLAAFDAEAFVSELNSSKALADQFRAAPRETLAAHGLLVSEEAGSAIKKALDAQPVGRIEMSLPANNTCGKILNLPHTSSASTPNQPGPAGGGAPKGKD